MSERASIQISGGSGGGSFKIVRLKNGEPTYFELSEDDRKAYTPPPDGKYHLQVTGVADTWKEPKRPEWIRRDDAGNIVGATETTFTRLEFEIMSGRGKGKRFSSKIPCSIWETSHLGKVWKAAGLNVNAATHEITDILGKEIEIYVERTDGIDKSGNKVFYANPTWSTAKAVGDTTEVADDGWEAA